MSATVTLLTPSEMRVLEQCGRGLSGAESALETWHKPSTVKFHRKHIVQKLHARNMTHAVVLAIRAGIIDIDQLA